MADATGGTIGDSGGPKRGRGRIWALVAALAAVVVVVVVLVAGGGGGGDNKAGSGEKAASAGGGKAVDHVTFAMNAEVPSLFVPNAWLVSTGTVMSLVQDGLLAFGDDLKLKPSVADKWSTPDPTTYVYHLRPGVKFSDGSPLTADDIVFSLKYNIDPKNASQLATFYASVKSIEATAPDEITIKLKNPDAQFAYTVAHMAGFIFKQSQYESNKKNFGTPSLLPIGTGPYKVDKFQPGQSVDLSVNPNYWGPKPKVKRITLRTITDPQTAQLAMRSGEIDGNFEVPVQDFDQWSQIDSAKVVTTPSLNVYMLTMNVNRPPFDDINVRRAFWYAVDRKGLVQAALKGKGQVANAINPPQMWAGVLNADEVTGFYDTLTPPDFDIAKAKEEMAKSKTPDGFNLNVKISSDLAPMAPIAQSLTNTLGEIGVKLKTTSVNSSAFYADYNDQRSPFYIRSYAPDFADPVNYPWLFLHSANAVKNGLNASQFKNPEFDAALDKGIQETDPAARAKAIEDALKIADEQVPIVPIFWPDTAVAVNNDLKFDGFTAFYYNQPWALGISGA